MKNIVRLLFVALLIAGAANSAKAEMFVGQKDGGNRSLKQTTAGCSPSSAFEWLNINNVRTRINAGGDMWWDLPSGTGSKYYVPANGSATSLFAGSLWIAGVDVNNQLKCAAVRFRQDGNDFWTGPLTITGAAIDDVTCAQWDRIFRITRAEVDEFLLHFDGNGIDQTDGYVIPNSILEWPAHPEALGTTAGVSRFLAPFYDQNGDGEYNPGQGDYPYYDIDNVLCHTKTPTMEEELEGSVHGSILADQVLKGDQTLWWIFNDKGSAHTESDGSPIGIEVRGQAFGFATNDEINNMTFCSYEIINRSTYVLQGTYFCPWTDVDLGYGWDDYVGCDVQRGLGYGYNGNSVDGNGEPESYGDQPPAVGIDFFQGPYMDPDQLDNPKYNFTVNVSYTIDPVTHDTLSVNYDTINMVQLCDESINGVNFGNGIVDDERFGMRRFLYHNNTGDHLGDPHNAAETYNLLRGYWKDGNRMQYGGNAYPGAEGTVGPDCDFMFPGDTDPCNWGTAGIPPGDGFNVNGKYWTEETAGNQPNDRRFMQSAGPFTLQPGAVNYITFGVPWARATSGGPFASVELLRVTDDKCQALFDNCFKVIDGPNAPDLTIRELDQKLIIYLSNSPISNNYKEGYKEIDPEIPELRPDDTTGAMYADRYYRFEGYKVYQLVNGEVGADELSDNNKARLIFQCDVKNTVTRLVNYEFDNYIGANVPSLKVDGGDAGITHSFVVTEDKFSNTENTALVNHKTYYFMAVAYAYNNFFPYSQEPGIINGLYGQMKPYLEGRKNISCYSAVPHKIVNGTVMRCEYGDKPVITRLVGQGNGGNELELSQECIDELFTKKLANSYDENGKKVVFGHPDYPILYHPTYKVGYGPLDVKIVDPLNVKTTDYELWFDTLFSVYSHGVTTNQSVVGDSAERMASHWFLKDLNSDEPAIMSDTTTVYTNEQMFVDRGISVSITQQYPVGPVTVGSILDHNAWVTTKEVVTPRSGLLTSSLTFQDSTNRWLDGIRDKDIPGSVLNWIRSGTYIDQDDKANADFNMTTNTPYDPGEHFEKIANRTWAPFNLCSFEKQGFATNPGPVAVGLARTPRYYPRISSVDIVLTADRSKWTRCPVVEMCMDNSLSEGNAKRFFLRRHASIDKDGNPTDVDWKNHPEQGSDNPEDANYIAAQGMGWFPGYAIDIESGARLNIVYGEDSYCEDLNGRDLLFNPPALLKATVEEMYGDYSQNYDPSIFRQIDGDPVMGGKHFVYIFGMDKPTGIESDFDHIDFVSPAYDGGAHSFHVLREQEQIQTGYQNTVKEYFWRTCMYVGMPMGVEGTNWLAPNNDAKIRIRVAKPYDKGYYTAFDLDSVTADLNINNMYPKYKFSIEGMNPAYNDPEKTESDLDLITIVPNPYYAYSTYEANALNNKVKITNLPNNCVVTIYNIAGTKIRQFKKDNEDPSLDWDLTNFANTPVASGFYLIHVKDNVSGGERTIKFFGAMRQIDLNTF